MVKVYIGCKPLTYAYLRLQTWYEVKLYTNETRLDKRRQ